jgi:RimJ/RimL family protein N-acetyltransferase
MQAAFCQVALALCFTFGSDLMACILYRKLVEPTAEIAAVFECWDNDAEIVPFIRPSPSKEDLEKKLNVTVDDLRKRLQTHQFYLIYLEELLVGVMDYQVDPPHCYLKVNGTAWIGINIGEKSARHRGIGYEAMNYLENQIRSQGLKRIELGVFEYNENARRLYLKLGYAEIGRIKDFTYWDGKMWQDIRMEKLLT